MYVPTNDGLEILTVAFGGIRSFDVEVSAGSINIYVGTHATSVSIRVFNALSSVLITSSV
jgi:hypothetical protein